MRELILKISSFDMTILFLESKLSDVSNIHNDNNNNKFLKLERISSK